MLLARLTKWMNVVGTCMVVFLMLVILIDIGGRLFFSQPLPGTPEIVAMSIAVIVYLQFPSTLRAGRVISADGFCEWLGRRSVRAEQWVLALHHAVGAAMFAISGYFLFLLFQKAFDNGDFFGTAAVFVFPKWPILALICFGSLMMALQYLMLCVQFVHAGIERRRLLDIDPANKVLS